MERAALIKRKPIDFLVLFRFWLLRWIASHALLPGPHRVSPFGVKQRVFLAGHLRRPPTRIPRGNALLLLHILVLLLLPCLRRGREHSQLLHLPTGRPAVCRLLRRPSGHLAHAVGHRGPAAVGPISSANGRVHSHSFLRQLEPIRPVDICAAFGPRGRYRRRQLVPEVPEVPLQICEQAVPFCDDAHWGGCGGHRVGYLRVIADAE